MILRIGRRVSFCLLILGIWTTARGELVLANYSAANPIKVMAIGDSITDDGNGNGAWRLYLQPLLETNGYPFTFVGRNQSATNASFTKPRHEGYSGAVIASPGVLTSPVHGYTGTDVYLQKIVADAFTNGTTADLVLVLIGVNDIGRGRNPFQVATNDMPKLLDLIFSNAPNASVILAKVTSLNLANLAGLNYAAYATNISIYNAALQAMVNQRRAIGQNVSLADMFSVVSSAMFNPDHVHPNAQGLQAIAQEWLARIQAITVTTSRMTTTLVHGGEVWKYSDTGQDLGTNWSQPDYDDSGWAAGPARLGYGDPEVFTTYSYGPDPLNRYITTYFRHWFDVSGNVVFTNLNFRLSRVDGAVVWLNGQELFRMNMPAGMITNATLAPTSTAAESAYIFFPTNLAVSGLPGGTNLLAVELHLRIGTRQLSGMDLELLGTGYLLPPPLLSIGLSDGNVQLSWPLSNGAGFTLYSTTNLTAGNWIVTGAATQTNSGQIVVTQSLDANAKFYLLQRP